MQFVEIACEDYFDTFEFFLAMIIEKTELQKMYPTSSTQK